MVVTLEQRRRELLRDLGVTWEQIQQVDAATFMEKALACIKTDTGYQLVLPPSGGRKKWQARTSGKDIGQRQLASCDSAEEAGRVVINWILGITPTPPTPPKDRMPRGKGIRKLDRCNRDKGVRTAFYFPSDPSPDVSQCSPLFCRWPGPAHHRVPAEKSGASSPTVACTGALAGGH